MSLNLSLAALWLLGGILEEGIWDQVTGWTIGSR